MPSPLVSVVLKEHDPPRSALYAANSALDIKPSLLASYSSNVLLVKPELPLELPLEPEPPLEPPLELLPTVRAVAELDERDALVVGLDEERHGALGHVAQARRRQVGRARRAVDQPVWKSKCSGYVQHGPM